MTREIFGRHYTLSGMPWSTYPLRTCRSLHSCEICSLPIVMGEQYRDGGYGRRAHEACYLRTEASPSPAESEGA